MSSKLEDVCRANIGFVLTLVGFDVAILAFLFSDVDFLIRFGCMVQPLCTCLTLSIFVLTYAFFTYHTVLTGGQVSEGRVKLANYLALAGLALLFTSVPLLIWVVKAWVALAISIFGILFFVYLFFIRRRLI